MLNALTVGLVQFGTDYLYAAKLGGKVTQQTSAKEDTSSSTRKADLAESSSTSFECNFMKLDTSSSSAHFFFFIHFNTDCNSSKEKGETLHNDA